jgi:hypothetical protein
VRKKERTYVNVHKELYDFEHTKKLYECVVNIISLYE